VIVDIALVDGTSSTIKLLGKIVGIGISGSSMSSPSFKSMRLESLDVEVAESSSSQLGKGF
jgi:hypothetical protein